MRAFVARHLAVPLWIWRSVRQNSLIRGILLYLLAINVIGYIFLGNLVFEIMGVAGDLAIRLGFALMFMVVQFGGLIWFMSRTRTTIVRPGDPKMLTLEKDYWGQPALVELVVQWLHLLTDRTEFQAMGGQHISGLLLYGDPGTGKTLLAKCMAGSGRGAFIGCEGSSFRGMFWGMDTLKVMSFVGKARKLAREHGACIAYIDEIDSIGASRGGVMGGGMMMGGMMGGGGSGALTRLLYEMDGVGDVNLWTRCVNDCRRLLRLKPVEEGVVLFMGSTNRPDVLDPALLRPGRFDEKIRVDLPDKVGRAAIMNGYLSRVRHDETVDVPSLVATTPHTTPAQIMSAITKDAVRLALFDGRKGISQMDIESSLLKQAVGMPNPISDMEPAQREQIAVHEAGHAVAQYHLMPREKLLHTSITRRGGGILGFMLAMPDDEQFSVRLSDIRKRVQVSLAGHVATEILLGEAWTGAGGDLVHVSGYVRALANFGEFAGEFPLMGDDYSDGIKSSVNVFVRAQLAEIAKLIKKHKKEVRAVADALLERNDLSGAEVVSIIKQNEKKKVKK